MQKVLRHNVCGVQSLSCIWVFETPWTVAHQPPLSLGFLRQEHWTGLPFPPPGDLPDPGIEPTSHVSSTLAGRFFTTSTTYHCSWTWFFCVCVINYITGNQRRVYVDRLLYVLYMCFHELSIEFVSIPKFEKSHCNYLVRTETNNYILRTVHQTCGLCPWFLSPHPTLHQSRLSWFLSPTPHPARLLFFLCPHGHPTLLMPSLPGFVP